MNKGQRVVSLWRFGGFQKQAGPLLLIPVARGWYNLYNTAAKDILLLYIKAQICRSLPGCTLSGE